MYYLIYALVYLLSLLPTRALYFLSDGLYILLYYVIGYRKTVVMINLGIAFPEKTHADRKKIAKQFYHNFIDSYIEMIKLLSAPDSFIKAHFRIENPEIYEEIFRSGRRCQILLGHTLNWEYANLAIPFYTSYHFLVAYMPLTNKPFDRFLLRLRGRTGAVLVASNQMNKALIPHRNELYMLALVADQAPSNPQAAFWLNFFGRPTAFLRGPERGARMADMPVLFCSFYKLERGHYRAKLQMCAEHPAELAPGQITRSYVNFLQEAIRERPELYLWSHRRWKYGWKKEFEKMWIDPSDNLPLAETEDS
jgi:Kdo2-lipid IVA lauroyltransferase/acyltransferase